MGKLSYFTNLNSSAIWGCIYTTCCMFSRDIFIFSVLLPFLPGHWHGREGEIAHLREVLHLALTLADFSWGIGDEINRNEDTIEYTGLAYMYPHYGW